ncbi:MAG: pyridoxal 5'-phosphate synthase glutaminase subunit PdxT [Oscillospiraceae bacterium]|nr:pyridoxal 5'-phosphate synthase glutaminase subunit PdxT [Oscillospiraceae bacterium]
MRIGVLALQGAFAEHIKKLDELDVESFEIRQLGDIKKPFDGLILPGGESTVMGKLLRDLELLEPLKALICDGMPVFGTCAGLLLLAKDFSGEGTPVFSSMDIKARRNAYGRQLGSFCANADFLGVGNIQMTFIRAPYIESAGADVTVLSETGGHIVAATQGKQLVTAFHPELNEGHGIHKYFLEELR